MPFIDTTPRNCHTCLKGKLEDIKVVIRSRQNDVRFVFTSSFLYERSCLLRYLCLIAYSGVQHILCCVFVLFCFSSSSVPYVASFSGLCIFFITPVVFSNVYSKKDRQCNCQDRLKKS